MRKNNFLSPVALPSFITLILVGAAVTHHAHADPATMRGWRFLQEQEQAIEQQERARQEARLRHLNARDEQGATRLHSAVRDGDGRAVQDLLGDLDFTEVNARTVDGATALHWAAEWHKVPMVSALLEHPRYRQVNAVDNMGETALHKAVRGGNPAVIELILASPRFSSFQTSNGAGYTAEMLLTDFLTEVELGYDEMVAFFHAKTQNMTLVQEEQDPEIVDLHRQLDEQFEYMMDLEAALQHLRNALADREGDGAFV